jgi:predicted amidophosphoribosyltransferase
LAKTWLLDSPQFDGQPLVVPIPLHPDKLSTRGYNQAGLIAQGFCQITGFKLQLTGLARVKQTQVQHGLSPVERKKNLLNAFVVNQTLSGRLNSQVLLVDDIYTTGATANSAKQTLERSGVSVLGIAVVAAALVKQKHLNGH